LLLPQHLLDLWQAQQLYQKEAVLPACGCIDFAVPQARSTGLPCAEDGGQVLRQHCQQHPLPAAALIPCHWLWQGGYVCHPVYDAWCLLALCFLLDHLAQRNHIKCAWI
jgi:hypothetical protein